MKSVFVALSFIGAAVAQDAGRLPMRYERRADLFFPSTSSEAARLGPTDVPSTEPSSSTPPEDIPSETSSAPATSSTPASTYTDRLGNEWAILKDTGITGTELLPVKRRDAVDVSVSTESCMLQCDDIKACVAVTSIGTDCKMYSDMDGGTYFLEGATSAYITRDATPGTSAEPSGAPAPSGEPSGEPSGAPAPSGEPSGEPSGAPQPSGEPSSEPSMSAGPSQSEGPSMSAGPPPSYPSASVDPSNEPSKSYSQPAATSDAPSQPAGSSNPAEPTQTSYVDSNGVEYTVYANTGISGTAISSLKKRDAIITDSVQECMEKCDKLDGCVAFTFFNGCIYYSEVEGTYALNGATSGIKEETGSTPSDPSSPADHSSLPPSSMPPSMSMSSAPPSSSAPYPSISSAPAYSSDVPVSSAAPEPPKHYPGGKPHPHHYPDPQKTPCTTGKDGKPTPIDPPPHGHKPTTLTKQPYPTKKPTPGNYEPPHYSSGSEDPEEPEQSEHVGKPPHKPVYRPGRKPERPHHRPAQHKPGHHDEHDRKPAHHGKPGHRGGKHHGQGHRNHHHHQPKHSAWYMRMWSMIMNWFKHSHPQPKPVGPKPHGLPNHGPVRQYDAHGGRHGW